MIDNGKWKPEEPNVTNLLLDPNNPRIPDSGKELSQRDLIADLLENDKVYELARSIVTNGYYPVESLIVVIEKGKKYVVEGNRRLAALKLLLSPEGAPEKWERRMRSLSNQIEPNSIRKVKVIRAPSRDAAAPVIMSKHTRTQVESWTPIMQAKFYHNLVQQGLNVADIAQQYKIAPSEITSALRRYTMYSVACALELPEEIAKTVQNPRVFASSTLMRLHENPRVNEFLGISFDEQKRLVGTVDPAEFKKGYTKIVTDVVTGEADSRKLNTWREMNKYLDTFGGSKPNLKKKGSFTAESLLKSAKPKTIATPKAAQKKAKSRSTPRALIPKSFPCTVNNDRINKVCDELKRLDLALYPNAVGLMFRSLLELGLGYYLDRTGHLKTITDKHKARKQDRVRSDWHPTLTQMLNHLVAEDTHIITNGNLLKALRKINSQQDELISIDSLNLFVHNQHFAPKEETLRTFWNQLQGLFEIILVEPEPPTTTPAGSN
jgi:hypothetical protein